MKFTFNGRTFVIEFARHGGVVPGRVVTISVETDDILPDGTPVFVEKVVPIPTRYPYTTVRLMEVTGQDEKGRDILTPFRTATVGAYYKENFTHESGRRAALEALLKGSFDMGQMNQRGVPTQLNQESRPFRKALWDAYHNRKKA